jgi:hypothetical protein
LPALIEYRIVTDLTALRAAFKRVKDRAPDSADLFPDGAWARWKERRASP